ncbi:MAG TPA: DUF434 domain-containing protein [Blastocatellia bacterium]
MSPDARKHRGANPSDEALFHPDSIPELREAMAELSWLLTRDYAPASSLKLVGDRHKLTERQRAAVARAACSDRRIEARARAEVAFAGLRDSDVAIDGFNLIITVEAALSGAVLIHCRDTCFRDISSVHGSYRSVEETSKAIEVIGAALASACVHSVAWHLDKPVSNSGRLANRIRAAAEENAWPWTVELCFNPDSALIDGPGIAITSDSVILDRVSSWSNLTRYILTEMITNAWVIDLVGSSGFTV